VDIPAKLKSIGYTFAPKTTNGLPLTFTSEDITKLAIMEHDRFVKERLSNGWRYGEVRDLAEKTSPSLVPWEKLKEDGKKKDLDAVRDIPKILNKAGFEIRKL